MAICKVPHKHQNRWILNLCVFEGYRQIVRTQQNPYAADDSILSYTVCGVRSCRQIIVAVLCHLYNVRMIPNVSEVTCVVQYTIAFVRTCYKYKVKSKQIITTTIRRLGCDARARAASLPHYKQIHALRSAFFLSSQLVTSERLCISSGELNPKFFALYLIGFDCT